MHILGDAEPKVSGVAAIAESPLVDVNTRAEELDDVEREIGEVLGIGGAAALSSMLSVPISFQPPVPLLAPFPVTVALALIATLAPAWRFAGASPALLRRV